MYVFANVTLLPNLVANSISNYFLFSVDLFFSTTVHNSPATNFPDRPYTWPGKGTSSVAAQ